MDDSNTIRFIVLIDDDADFLHVMKRRLQSLRAEFSTSGTVDILTFTDPVEALVNLPAGGICVTIIDYNMPEGTGLEWLPQLLRSGIGPVILLTNNNDAHVTAEAFRAGAADYISKKDAIADDAHLARSLREAAHRYRLETRNQSLTRQLKLVNSELESRNKQLKELTETAHRFVDDVAHDFRTPLTVIQQYASLVTEGLTGPVTENQKDHLSTIIEATRELTEMVEDFLDSSKLRARALPVYRQSHSVRELFDFVEPMLAVRAEARHIPIEYSIAESVGPFFGDLSKATRVLANLGVNAIKVTPASRPLKVWARPLETGDVQIGVTDEGPGLKPEDLQIIFERFKQIEEPHVTNTKGFGLGLSIVKLLSWLNLGSIDVISEYGKGSTFAFTLPSNRMERILACFLSSIQSLELPGDIWMLKIRAAGESPDLAMLRRVVSTFSYPMDLILEDADQQSVNAVGVSGNANAWADRIRAEAARFHRSVTQQEARELEIKIAGSWPRDVNIAKLHDALTRSPLVDSCPA